MKAPATKKKPIPIKDFVGQCATKKWYFTKKNVQLRNRIWPHPTPKSNWAGPMHFQDNDKHVHKDNVAF